MTAGGVRISVSGEVVIGDCNSGVCIETPFVDNGVFALRLSDPWLPAIWHFAGAAIGFQSSTFNSSFTSIPIHAISIYILRVKLQALLTLVQKNLL